VTSAAEETDFVVRQRARVSGHGSVWQVAGNYEDNRHTFVTGRLPLRAVPIDAVEIRLAERAYLHSSPGQQDVATGLLEALRPSAGQRNILVVLGDPNSGRRTTALWLLRQLGLSPKEIYGLELDWDTPRVEQLPRLESSGYVLDLTAYESLTGDFYADLSTYQSEVQCQLTYLIILATPGAWRPGVASIVRALPVTPPTAHAVALSHLRAVQEDRAGWLNEAPLAQVLAERASPGEGARLAKVIALAEDSDEGRARAADEFQDWWNHLSHWFASSERDADLADRALLIATALLDGAPCAVIMDAADKLLRSVDGNLPAGGALAGRDLEKRLLHIDAARTGDTLSLDARRRGVDHAVLEYVWEQRPQLRSTLLEWASDISGSKGVAKDHLQRVAVALTQLAAVSDGGQVLAVLTDWIDQGSAPHHRLAVGILGTLGLDPVLGVVVRKNLYDWARQKRTSEDLARAVAEVCGGPLGQHYPRMALTRLRLLAAREDGHGADAVASALRDLAATPELRALILSDVVAWAESTDEASQVVGATVFLMLTDLATQDSPGQALAADLAEQGPDSTAMALFARGWQATWRHASNTDRVMASLATWLDLPNLAQDVRTDIAEAVVREQLGKAGVAKLLLGDAFTSSGKAVRETVLDRLMSDLQHTPEQEEQNDSHETARSSSSDPVEE
jgi:hypothetical protein